MSSPAEWHKSMELIVDRIVKVSTPKGIGTGFLIASSKKEKQVGIATAAHVINDCYEWGHSMQIMHYKSGQTALLEETDRAIHRHSKQDFALIRFSQGVLPFPEPSLKLTKHDKHIKEGSELGWCGFPSVYSSKLCFFSGRVSALLEEEKSYLADGAAINGVCGGPAFSRFGKIIGLMTAYLLNTTTGEPLPGVALIRSVALFIDLFDKLKLTPTKSDSDSDVD